MTAELFNEAANIIARKFGDRTADSTAKKRFWATKNPRVRVYAERWSDKHFQVCLAYEQRPGVWFNLGDLVFNPDVPSADILTQFGVSRCSARTDLDGTAVTVHYARTLKAG